MIGAIRGKVLEKQAPYLLIEMVSGLSYELQASMTTFYRLPAVSEEVFLYTHHVVREDAQLLFGFYTQEERTLFRSLIKVNGVGPKVALTLLSSIELDALVRCIMDQDSASLIKLPGVGRKTAERLLIEMRDRCGEWNVATAPVVTGSGSSSFNDAVSALVSLGYKSQDALSVLAKVKEEGMTTEELIRFALKGMVPC